MPATTTPLKKLQTKNDERALNNTYQKGVAEPPIPVWGPARPRHWCLVSTCLLSFQNNPLCRASQKVCGRFDLLHRPISNCHNLLLASLIHPPNVTSTATLQELRVVAVDHRLGAVLCGDAIALFLFFCPQPSDWKFPRRLPPRHWRIPFPQGSNEKGKERPTVSPEA